MCSSVCASQNREASATVVTAVSIIDLQRMYRGAVKKTEARQRERERENSDMLVRKVSEASLTHVTY